MKTPNPSSNRKALFKFVTGILAIPAICLLIVFTSDLYRSHMSAEAREEKEEEEREGLPESIRQMDLWSDMRTYPNKVMEASQYNSSYLQARAMMAAQNDNTANPSSVMANFWTELGPKNFAGRILSIGFHPTNANIMWVGSASGGLYKTTTGGTGAPGGINWTYVPTGFPVLGVSSIAVNPLNGNEIYIGTGEVYSSNPGGSTGAGHIRTFRGSYGIGILKSIDGGTTWTKTLDFSANTLRGVMDLLIHPTTPSTVFAATTDGVYRTTNSGASWTLIHPVTYAMDMHFKPGNPSILYVGSGNFQSAGTGIYKTTNATAASPTFSLLTSPAFPNPISGKIQLAISAANPSKIYASIGRDPNITTHTQGLYISNDEGATWAASGAASMLGSQGWYGHDVAVSPTDANRIIWAELDTYLSTNGGGTITKTGSWSQWDVNNVTIGDLTEGVTNVTNYVHADVHRISPSPHNTNTFFLCTDGGLFRTTDGGATFNTLNGGLNCTQIYSDMAINPTNANYMLIGLQDNEAMVYEGNPGCRRIGSLGDGFHAAMNSNGTIQLVESYYFNRRRSTNSGSSFGAGSGAVPTTENACFNVPMVFSRVANSAYMFAGTNLFKRSTNSGSTWTNLNGGNPIAGSSNPAIAMVAPTNDVVYFSTGPGGGVRSKLWKTTNATAANPTFTEITGTLPDRYYSGIEVDPTNTNRVIVTCSGFGSSHVFLSVDGGSTWSDISGSLPDVPHNSVFINPSARGQIYVGNDLGVFVANNVPLTGPLGPTTSVYWNNYSAGLGDATMATDILITSTGKLRLATYGRGLWENDLASLTLPIVMKDFKGWATDKGNQLQWIVSSQTNVNRFELEYSSDGSRFTKIATVSPKAGSGEASYTQLHQFSNISDAFYRVRIVDNDGTYQYSTVVLVKAQKLTTKVTAFPNPVVGDVNVRLTAPVAGPVDIKVYTISGSLVFADRRNLTQGANTVTIDARRLAAGNYQVVLESSARKWISSIVKQ